MAELDPRVSVFICAVVIARVIAAFTTKRPDFYRWAAVTSLWFACAAVMVAVTTQW